MTAAIPLLIALTIGAVAWLAVFRFVLLPWFGRRLG